MTRQMKYDRAHKVEKRIYYFQNRDRILDSIKDRQWKAIVFLDGFAFTTKDYRAWYKHQNGECKICGVRKFVLSVDYDHETGLFRGLLCGRCNSGLGYFKDNKQSLHAAIDYLNSDYPCSAVRV